MRNFPTNLYLPGCYIQIHTVWAVLTLSVVALCADSASRTLLASTQPQRIQYYGYSSVFFSMTKT